MWVMAYVTLDYEYILDRTAVELEYEYFLVLKTSDFPSGIDCVVISVPNAFSQPGFFEVMLVCILHCACIGSDTRLQEHRVPNRGVDAIKISNLGWQDNKPVYTTVVARVYYFNKSQTVLVVACYRLLILGAWLCNQSLEPSLFHTIPRTGPITQSHTAVNK